MSARMMRAVAVHRPNDFGIVEVPRPAPGEYQALVRILTCGICGTDRSIVHGAFPLRAYPCLLGHEAIGRVESVGPGVTSLAPGDLVLRPSGVAPGQTPDGFNSQWGGFAEWGLVWDREALSQRAAQDPGFRVPGTALQQQKVPQAFDPVDAGMFITFKECLSFLQLLGGVADKDVLVTGTGPVAVTFVQACRLLGARAIAVLGRRPDALARFMAVGADIAFDIEGDAVTRAVRSWAKQRGVQLVVDTTGAPSLIGMATSLLCEGGEVALYGVGPDETVPLQVQLGKIANNFAVRRVGPREHAVHEEALQALAAGQVDLRASLTHVLPLDAVEAAFALLDRREAWKIVIDMRD